MCDKEVNKRKWIWTLWNIIWLCSWACGTILSWVVYVLYNQCVCAQLCLTLCDPMDCSPSGSSVHGIFQARILEWVAISFSRGSSWPRDWTCVSWIFSIGRWILYHWASWKAMYCTRATKKKTSSISFVSWRSCTVPGLWNTRRKSVCGLNSEWMNSSQIWLNTFVLMPYICTFVTFFKVFPHISFPWCDY